MAPGRTLSRAELLLLPILLVGLALRCYLLDGQSLWYDEGVSAFMTTRGPAEIARAAAADIHPPLYYWLLAAWAIPFGDGEIALRSFSVVVGTLGIWVTWELARRLYDEVVGLVAAILLAISPLAIHYSQEVRMYALAGLLAAAATWAYMANLAPRSSLPSGRWARGVGLYALLAAALLYTHYYGLLVLAAHQVHTALTIVFGRRRDILVPWLAASGLVALLYLPWLPHALRQTGYYPGLGTPQPGWALAVDAVNVLALGIATTRFAFRLGLAPFLVLALVGLLRGVGGRGSGVGGRAIVIPSEARNLGASSEKTDIRRFAQDDKPLRPRPLSPDPRPLLALWLVVPIGGIIVLSATRPLYEPRFLMLVLPAWVILVAAGAVVLGRVAICRLSELPGLAPTTRGIVIGALATTTLGSLLVPTIRSLTSYYHDPAYARDDYRGLARRVAELERPGDAIVLTAPGQAEIFGYYYRGSSELFPLPARRPIDPTDTRTRLESLASSHRRVWLVRWAAAEADPDDLIARWLEARGRALGSEHFGRVELRLYDLTAAARAEG